MKYGMCQSADHQTLTMIRVQSVSDFPGFGDGPETSAPFCMLRGELHNGGLPEPLPFTGYNDLALKLDVLFCAAADGRTPGGRAARYAALGEGLSRKSARVWDGTAIQRGRGRRANFLVNVHARQNGSWQGSARWIEGRETRYFRSVWELLCLIEGALNCAELPFARKNVAELPEPAARQLSGNAPIVLVQVRSVLEYAVVEAGRAVGPVRTMRGEFYNGCFSQGLAYLGLDDLVMKLDAMFDYLDFPQGGEELRAFGRREKLRICRQEAERALPPLEQAWDGAALREPPEAYSSFFLYVYARRNAGWQGILRWRGGADQRFESVLELFQLVESGLDREMSAGARESAPLVRGALG